MSKFGKRKIAIGVFLHNEEKHCKEAIESLLRQTYSDFKLIILDDASTDGTEKIVRNLQKKDLRISFYENKTRKGYIYNYRKTFELAGDNIDYFAWAAGHDRHHSRWLEILSKCLDDHPDVVMAYPKIVRISDSGKILPVPSTFYDNTKFDVFERIKITALRANGFGNMIYGLFRRSAIKKAGIFRYVLMPDMMLLAEMCPLGCFMQIKKELWYRRYIDLFSIKRQKKIAFESPPWYINLPWPIVNSFVLFWNHILSPRAGSFYDRYLGLILSLFFFIRSIPKLKRDSPVLGKLFVFPLLKIIKRVLTIKSKFKAQTNYYTKTILSKIKIK